MLFPTGSWRRREGAALAYHVQANKTDRHWSDRPVSPHLAPNPSAKEMGGITLTTRDWESSMDRRTLLKGLAGVGSLAATGGLSMPALSQGASARTLRFVPQANLANFDPIWGTQYVVRNASALVWDTLYGVNDKLVPQRQMVESEQVSSDGLTWTFKLRPGLKFHDGEPVRAKDVVASITRWSARDPMGLMLKATQKELTALDDRSFKWVLSKPFPKMLIALGKNNTPIAFIMPERIGQTGR